MDEPELTDPNDYELDIELCKLVSRIPFFGENLAKNICNGIDYSGEFHETFSKFVKVGVILIIFIIFIIIYFFVFEKPLNKMTAPDWGDAFDIGDFYKPIKKGKYICYQPKTELIDIPMNNIYDFPVPPPPPPPTINYGPSLI